MTYFAQEKDLEEMKNKPLSEKEVTLEWNGYITKFHSQEDVKEAVENFLKEFEYRMDWANIKEKLDRHFGKFEEARE